MREFTDWLLLGGVMALALIALGAYLMFRGAREVAPPPVRPPGVPLGPPTADHPARDESLRALRRGEPGVESRRARVRHALPAAAEWPFDEDAAVGLRIAQLEIKQRIALELVRQHIDQMERVKRAAQHKRVN